MIPQNHPLAPHQQQELPPVEAIVSTLERINNEQLGRLIDEIGKLYKSVNESDLSILLSPEHKTQRDTLFAQVKQVKEAVYQEWGKRLLRGHRSRFKRLVAEIQPPAPEHAIISFPVQEGEEEQETSHTWMVCISTQRDQTLFRDGIPVILEQGNTLDEIRQYVGERIGEQDRYTEVYAALDLGATQLHALIGQASGNPTP
jgi:hypothetical protein